MVLQWIIPLMLSAILLNPTQEAIMQRARERQAKPQTARALVGPAIHFIAQNYDDNSTTIAIGGVRWEYFLTPGHNRVVDYLARKVSSGKALAYAKAHALRTEQVRP
jgi:hypothetical protein